ncbi:hypothetical protein R9C00_02805 [Flammeovirgaceae bacterium SG7u.111]|nr:hypothetical protein [Flammeovirgaceae bacterium SG7u.132]WPO36370.1 hypothetical protein R9C00_02805 [Flammeovirgaceae bacterium SG7u.111]
MDVLNEFHYLIRISTYTILYATLFLLCQKHNNKLPNQLKSYFPLGFLMLALSNITSFLAEGLRLANDTSYNALGIEEFYNSLYYIVPTNLSSVFYLLGMTFIGLSLILFLVEPKEKGIRDKGSLFSIFFFNLLTFGFYNIYWISNTFKTIGGEEGEQLGKKYGNWLIVTWSLLFSSYGLYLGFGNESLAVVKPIVTYITSLAFGITLLVASFHLKKYIVAYDSRFRMTDFSDLGIFFFTTLALQYGINDKALMKIKKEE